MILQLLALKMLAVHAALIGVLGFSAVRAPRCLRFSPFEGQCSRHCRHPCRERPPRFASSLPLTWASPSLNSRTLNNVSSLLLFGRSGLLRLVTALPGIIVFIVIAFLV